MFFHTRLHPGSATQIRASRGLKQDTANAGKTAKAGEKETSLAK